MGLDGLDPGLTESLMDAGALPNLAALRERGGYRRLTTTQPAQTPVAWSSFATGTNPGGHGIFDFLTRDPAAYRPEIALHGFERRGGFLPPRPVNRREGTPIWKVLGDAGVPSMVLRHPCTFPPEKTPRSRLLAGVGVPDLRGGFGTGTVYTTSPDTTAGDGERVVVIEPDGGGLARAPLVGPRAGGDDVVLELGLRFDAAAGRVRIESSGDPRALELAEGEWSGWLRVRFKLGLLQSARGLVRFHLVSARAPYLLYASPLNYDPEVPVHPISDPWDYAWELRREIGDYHTLGMAEDHSGLNNGRLSEAAFLDQCATVRTERSAMMRHELARHDAGLFFVLFDTPDRVQHMFWRYREPEHPANRHHEREAGMDDAIRSEYRACDDVVGQALEHAHDDTLVLVASDHGFAGFQREVHLNRWLHENGFLALRDDAGPGDAVPHESERGDAAGRALGSDGGGRTPADGAEAFADVDWSRTRAYALGLAGIFLNRAGREAEGVVREEDAPAVAAEIRRALAGLADPERGEVAVRSVVLREDAYRGPWLERAPDLLINTAPGYRVSSATALGGVPAALFSDNEKRWSGDHVVDPAAVPGILFSNRPMTAEAPHIIDLAPTILRTLGVPRPDGLEGRAIDA